MEAQGYKRLQIYQHLLRAYGSCEETIEHPELLFDTKSLNDESLFKDLHQEYNNLCGKILRFIQTIERTFDMPNFLKEPSADYNFDDLNNDVMEPFPSQNSKPETQTPKL